MFVTRVDLFGVCTNEIVIPVASTRNGYRGVRQFGFGFSSLHQTYVRWGKIGCFGIGGGRGHGLTLVHALINHNNNCAQLRSSFYWFHSVKRKEVL